MAESRARSVGVIGLGDMGIGMARNLVAAGFPTVAFDLRPERIELLEDIGGCRAASCAEVGARADAVFVMVLSGVQVREALLGSDGALEGMRAGTTVIVTATILPAEVQALQAPLAGAGVHLIDTPVSGGRGRPRQAL